MAGSYAGPMEPLRTDATKLVADESTVLPTLSEMVERAGEIGQQLRALWALPPEERARILAERCPTCGHHPGDDC